MGYVLSNLRKRPRQFQIGMMTIFLVVTFSTLLIAFLNSAHSLFFMIGQANAGDADFTIRGLSKSEQYEKAHDNFFTDR